MFGVWEALRRFEKSVVFERLGGELESWREDGLFIGFQSFGNGLVTDWYPILYRLGCGGGWRTNKRENEKHAGALGTLAVNVESLSFIKFECDLLGKYCLLLDCSVNGNPARTAVLFGNVGLRGELVAES